MHTQLIFDGGVKASVKNRVLWQMQLMQLKSNMQKSMNRDSNHTTFTKVISKWIIDIKAKCKTIKLEDNITDHVGTIDLRTKF